MRFWRSNWAIWTMIRSGSEGSKVSAKDQKEAASPGPRLSKASTFSARRGHRRALTMTDPSSGGFLYLQIHASPPILKR